MSLRDRARAAAEADRKAAAEIAKQAEARVMQDRAEHAWVLEGPLKADLQACRREGINTRRQDAGQGYEQYRSHVRHVSRGRCDPIS